MAIAIAIILSTTAAIAGGALLQPTQAHATDAKVWQGPYIGLSAQLADDERSFGPGGLFRFDERTTSGFVNIGYNWQFNRVVAGLSAGVGHGFDGSIFFNNPEIFYEGKARIGYLITNRFLAYTGAAIQAKQFDTLPDINSVYGLAGAEVRVNDRWSVYGEARHSLDMDEGGTAVMTGINLRLW